MSDKTTRQLEDRLRVNRANWKDTVAKCKLYNTEKSMKIKYEELVAPEPTTLVRTMPTVRVFHESMYDLLDALNEEKFRNILLINPSGTNSPMPGLKKGADGEEFDLFRRSNYYETAEESFYPIQDGEALYSPTVVIFKDDNGKRIEKPVSVSILSIPPINRPSIISMQDSGSYVEVFESSGDEARTKKRIDAMFKMAISKGHDTLVITNYGGGVHQNPTRPVVKMFNDAIKTYNVPYVLFAIRTNADIVRDKAFLIYHKNIVRY